MVQNAPPPALDFSIDAEQVKKITDDIIEIDRAANDEVAALKPEERTYENIVQKLTRVENALQGKYNLVTSLYQISPEESVRNASLEAEMKSKQFQIEQMMRYDVYTVIKSYIESVDKSTLDSEDARWLTKVDEEYRRNGLHLPEETRNQYKELQQKISDLCTEFNKNLAAENSSVNLTKSELEGMDDDYLNGLKSVEEDGIKKFAVTMKYPDVVPALKLCKNENTRKALKVAYESRNHENISILEKTVKLRRESAKLLGYPTHAAYQLEDKMAKTVDNVEKFLKDLRSKLCDAGEDQLAALKELKKKEKEERGEAFDGQINSWDWNYYDNILLETKYAVDDQLVKQYFSLDTTILKMLEIYEKVLGLKFYKTPAEDAVVWHPDVQLFECWDAAEDKTFLGHMYLDLFPRDKKYNHAACFPLHASYIDEDGEEIHPIAAMVANFSKPSADKPSLLRHDEVVTLFHELGHVMHCLCSRTKLSRFHGTSVENDFVEAPSQMLENWCFDKESLRLLSAHYKTGEKIPDNLIDRISAAKNANAAIKNLRQLFFGIFDMQLHTTEDENIDSTELYNRLCEEVSRIKLPKGTYGQASFGHLMGGYDAGYYGYMWSKVFSSDMFFSKFKKDTLSSETGYSYRKSILEKGGTKDGMDMLKEFLGREPSSEAFMREDIGVQ